MFRKRATPAPAFKQPAPYNPLTGKYAPLGNATPYATASIIDNTWNTSTGEIDFGGGNGDCWLSQGGVDVSNTSSPAVPRDGLYLVVASVSLSYDTSYSGSQVAQKFGIELDVSNGNNPGSVVRSYSHYHNQLTGYPWSITAVASQGGSPVAISLPSQNPADGCASLSSILSCQGGSAISVKLIGTTGSPVITAATISIVYLGPDQNLTQSGTQSPA